MKKTNRIFIIVIVLSLLISSIPIPNIGFFSIKAKAGSYQSIKSPHFIENIDLEPSVSSDYTEIYDASDLNNIRNNTAGKYILMSDIDLSSIENWNAFSANGMIIDGNGHVINNLSSTSKGLISTATGGTIIKNLGLENVSIISESNEVGGIVGRAKSVTITNCYVTGSISAKYDVGGICGNFDWDSQAIITSCYNLADVTAQSSYSGGIFGEIDTLQSETIKITKCYNEGNITAESSYAGGIIGYASGYGDQVKILTEQCYNTGFVFAKQYAGGIAGYQTGVFGDVRIIDCFNTGSVDGETYVGGIVGASCKTIMTSYNIGSVSGNQNVDAMVGLSTLTVWDNPRNCSLYNCFYLNTMNSTTSATKLSKEDFRKETSFQPSSTYYPFDFNLVWIINSDYNNHYPFLRCFDNIKWLFKSEVINEPKSIDEIEDFILHAYARDNENQFVPANGAEISVYSGASLLFTTTSDSSGKIEFSINDFLDRGLSRTQALHCTVSGHLNIADELYLCSESVFPDGTWHGTSIAEMLQYNLYSLFLEEPRLVVDLSIGFVGKNDKEKEKRFEKIKTMLEGYSQKLAEMTNGHALVNSFSLDAYSSDIELSNMVHDIYMFDDPSNTINLDVATASTYSGDDFSDFPHGGFIAFKYGNSVFSDKTLCHESGHLLFGFYDEYLSGFGYDRDLNGNGTIEKDEKNAGKWKNRGGKTERPTLDGIKAPDNFGVMDYQHDGLIELSNPASYAYLAGRNFESGHPEWYSLHYYKTQLSTEVSLAVKLTSMARGCGYTARYSLTNGTTQKAKYDYSKVDVGRYAAHSEGLLENDLSPIAEDAVAFSYDGNLIITGRSSDVQAELEDQNGCHVLQPTYEGDIFTIVVPVESKYGCLRITSTDNDLQETTQYYNIVKNDSGVFVNYKGNLNNGEYYSVANIIQVVYLNNNSDYELSKALTIDDNCDLSSASWFLVDDSSFSPIQTSRHAGINNDYTYSCLINSVGKYSLMAKAISEKQEQTLSNVSVRKDTEGEGILYLSFDDSSNNNECYTIYVSSQIITNPNSNEVLSITTTTNNDIAIYVDEEATYYFTIVTRSSDGSYSTYNNITSYTYKYKDGDNDGIPDLWYETYYQLKDIDNVANLDLDEDGLSNLHEYQLGTNPLSSDTDGDNVSDNIEIKYGFDPTTVCSNGNTNDYVAIYGEPDVSIQSVTFDENNLSFKTVNSTEGKAMRSVISVEADGETVALWTVNIGENSELVFDVPLSLVQNCHNLKICCDEGRITHDLDYENNSFIYTPSDSISFEVPSYSVAKGKNISPKLVVTPNNSNDIIAWKIDGTSATIDPVTGLVTAKTIGKVTVTANTLDGRTTNCEVSCVAFEGAEYSDFDSVLINNNTQVAITGYVGSDTIVSVPSSIGGKPVVSINNEALPSHITEVTLPESITTVSTTAFNNATTLTTIKVNENSASFKSKDGILYSADGTRIIRCPINIVSKDIILDDTVEEIGGYAFADADLSSVSLPEALQTIRSYAFTNNNFTTITIPEAVTTIERNSFENCSNLTTIYYNAISAQSGISTGFFASYLVPLNAIFRNDSGIETIVIGSKVQSIPTGLVVGLNNLKTINIATTSELQTIEPYAFLNDSSLSDVYYGNYFKQWKHVNISDNNTPLNNATIHFVECDVCAWDEGIIRTEATCVATGEKLLTCEVCGKECSETIAIDPNNHIGESSVIDQRNATCSVEGYTGDTICSSCKAVLKIGTTIPKGEHVWDNGTVTQPATCVNSGVKTFGCINCTATKEETIEAQGHDFDNWMKLDEKQHQRVCKKDSSHIEQENHLWGDAVTTKVATCVEAGSCAYTCSVCGATKVETVNAKGHSYGAWTKLNNNEHQRVCINNPAHVEKANHVWNADVITTEAKCETAGVRTYTCTACNATKTETINALGHTNPDGNGNCSRCGKHLKDVDSGNSSPAGACKYCGQVHGGAFGWLIKFFHSILALLGLRKK